MPPSFKDVHLVARRKAVDFGLLLCGLLPLRGRHPTSEAPHRSYERRGEQCAPWERRPGHACRRCSLPHSRRKRGGVKGGGPGEEGEDQHGARHCCLQLFALLGLSCGNLLIAASETTTLDEIDFDSRLMTCEPRLFVFKHLPSWRGRGAPCSGAVRAAVVGKSVRLGRALAIIRVRETS